jgi:heptosyltransferase-3
MPTVMNFSRILVIKLKQPGDVLVSSPVLAALKEAFPQARVSYLVPRGTEEMISHHPRLHGLLVVDRRGGVGEQWRCLRDLRRGRFDLVLELSGGDRGAFYAWVSGAGERLGFTRPGKTWQNWAFTRQMPFPPLKMHMVLHNLELLRLLGLTPPARPRLAFYWSPGVDTRVQKLLQSLGLRESAFAVMHPGAGWRFKCWTPAGYARVIEAVQGDWGLPVLLTASQAPHEQELLAAIRAACRVRPLYLAGKLTLKELGALIAKARFFFGVDSAPMHLAAAVNTPAAVLFGPSGDFNWGPWGEGHLVIKKDWDCIPCGQDGCEGSKISRCLREIRPEEVVAALAAHFLRAKDKEAGNGQSGG